MTSYELYSITNLTLREVVPILGYVGTAGEKFKLTKQYLVRFNADTKSHLTVMDADICLTKCLDKICTIFPAEEYKWEYPKGGHGIVFRLE